MEALTLSIAGLPAEFQQLRGGGVYWVDCARQADAELLCAQLLAAQDGLARAALLVAGSAPAGVSGKIDDTQGPAELAIYEIAAAQVAAALAILPLELTRALRGRVPPLCAILLPGSAVAALSAAGLQRFCAELRQWARRHAVSVVLLSHGESAALATRLLPLNDALAGLAQLYPAKGEFGYLLHFWRNGLGVSAAREFALHREQARGQSPRLALLRGTTMAVFGEGASDHRSYLADADVLEGAPPLSADWRLFEGWGPMLAHVAHAQASSVVFAIHGNSQVDPLAAILHRLRRERGNALKLVVREMAPCLRYADERLLMGCGATLIVPHGTPLARFLTVLESVQGNVWHGTLPVDIEAAAKAFRPPPVKGLVTPAQFWELVTNIEEATATSGLDNALVQLKPLRGLRPEQVLGQCRIRRQGDLACLYQGQIHLFLFACRREGVERALDRMFRLPWREIFIGYQLVARDGLAAMAQVHESVDRFRLASPHPGAAAAMREADPEALQPRPVCLSVEGEIQ